MPNFVGKVRSRDKLVREVTIQAKTKEEALQSMQKLGQVISITKKLDLGISAGLLDEERQVFFSRLQAMLHSRVGTSDALGLLRDTFTGRIQQVSSRILTYVEAGDDLPTAFEKVGKPDFSEATVALIKAGTRSGESWKAIKGAADFELQLAEIKKDSAKGLMSGIAGFFIAGALNLVSSLYLGPEIMNSDLIKAANKDGKMDLSFIDTLSAVSGYSMVLIMLVGLVLFALATVGKKINAVKADEIIMKIPFYNSLILARNNFIVLFGLALLIKSGVRTEEALRLSAEGAPKGALQYDLNKATEAVKSGRPWPKEMRTLHPTDRAALMSASDRTQIATTLQALSDQYKDLYAQTLASFVPVIKTLAALFLSIGGGLLFGQSILPMLMAAEGLG